MIPVEALHSVLIGALIAEVIFLRRRITKKKAIPKCEICGAPSVIVKATIDSDGFSQIDLCGGCFADAMKADAAEANEE